MQTSSEPTWDTDFSEVETTLVDEIPGPARWAGDDTRVDLLVGDSTDVELSAAPPRRLGDVVWSDPFEEPEPLPDAPTKLTPLMVPGGNARACTARTARTNPGLEMRPTLTDRALERRSSWARSATQARQSLASRRNEREALARVLALSKPRTPSSRPRPKASRRSSRRLIE